MKPVSTQALLLVIALSSRPYVDAAKQAGFRVVAIDAFADRQTHDAAERVFIVDYDEYGFNAGMLKSVVDGLNVNDYWGVIYGSGLEAQPAMLQYIADKFPLLGNGPATVAAVKTPDIFFAILDKLAIPFPRLQSGCPAEWTGDQLQTNALRKLIGGSGGTHIHYATDGPHSENHYHQEYLAGDSVSLLFLAGEGFIEVLGFNEQWLNPTPSAPFRYGGAVSNVQLTGDIQAQLVQAAQQLTHEFKLIGINSIDAIVSNGLVHVLEINPRLSASFDLYTDKGINIRRHIQACQSVRTSDSVVASAMNVHHAHAIVYAPHALEVPADFDWPDWTTDTPLKMNVIALHQPVCTVLATADHGDAAKQLAKNRVKMLLESMQQCIE